MFLPGHVYDRIEGRDQVNRCIGKVHGRHICDQVSSRRHPLPQGRCCAPRCQRQWCRGAPPARRSHAPRSHTPGRLRRRRLATVDGPWTQTAVWSGVWPPDPSPRRPLRPCHIHAQQPASDHPSCVPNPADRPIQPTGLDSRRGATWGSGGRGVGPMWWGRCGGAVVRPLGLRPRCAPTPALGPKCTPTWGPQVVPPGTSV